ncbi:MAG: hypothetical protein JWM82_3348 [Myxococcales bacterium]|nr:hypothetical protein [Myxococcales bacterium]
MPISAKVDAMIAEAEAADAAGGGFADTSAEEAVVESVLGPEEGAEAAAAAPPAAPPTPEEDAAKKAHLANIEEKLAAQRERQAARRMAQQAKEQRDHAEADRRAAAEERSKWEAARKDFKTGLTELGMNPREVYEEMTRQALEADTPEAQIKRMQAAWKAELEASLTPLKTEVEELRAERARLAAESYQAQVQRAFQAEVQAPEFQKLRIEYDDEQILDTISEFARDTSTFYPVAEKYGVQLRNPRGPFSMKEVLLVLKAAQDNHDQGKEQRSARLAPTTTQSPGDTQSPQPTSTVNGTAARSNAGHTISNELASTTASAPRQKLSRRERVNRLIAESDKR